MGKRGLCAGVSRFLSSLWCVRRDDSTLAGSEESTLVNCDAVCHIKRLPDPVLGAIFALSKDAEKGSFAEKHLPVERVVSQVAVPWRVVALGRPELWSSINARVRPEHQRELLQWYLAHSEGLPLDVHITLSRENWGTEGQLLLAEVLAEASRLRCLSIRADFPLAEDAVGKTCKRLSMPLLERFSFISLDQPHTFRDQSDFIIAANFSPLVFLNGAPRLAVLRLQHLENALYPPLTHITTLHLEEYQCPPMVCSRLLELFRAMPALVNLSLYGDVVASWPAAGQLHLPRLRSLRSASNEQVGSMLLALDAPVLDSLVLKDVREALKGHLGRGDGLRVPALRTLVLDGFVNVNTFATLFCELAGVVELRLINCDADDALQLLARRDDPLLPSLQGVMVHQVRDAAALDGVQARGVVVRVHCAVPWVRPGAERWTQLPPWPAELDRADADDLFMHLRRVISM